MSFSRFVQVGRVAVINYGDDEGKLCTIIDVVDHNRVRRPHDTAALPGPGASSRRGCEACTHLVFAGVLSVSPDTHLAGQRSLLAAGDRRDRCRSSGSVCVCSLVHPTLPVSRPQRGGAVPVCLAPRALCGADNLRSRICAMNPRHAALLPPSRPRHRNRHSSMARAR